MLVVESGHTTRIHEKTKAFINADEPKALDRFNKSARSGEF
jgi:hypothetical protein